MQMRFLIVSQLGFWNNLFLDYSYTLVQGLQDPQVTYRNGSHWHRMFLSWELVLLGFKKHNYNKCWGKNTKTKQKTTKQN